MSEPLQRKTTPVPAWHLVESVDPATERTISLQEKIFTAITELDALGWSGVATFPNGQWVLEFNSKTDPAQPSIRPVAGEWLVLDIGLLRRFSDADVAANFDEEA